MKGKREERKNILVLGMKSKKQKIKTNKLNYLKVLKPSKRPS